MSILRDQLNFNIQAGMSYRVKECDNCAGRGNSDAVQITRKADGFLWHCFRCSKSGFFPDSGASPSEVQKVIKNANREKKDTRPDVVTLPDDFTSTLPPKASVQLWDFGITDKDMARFNVGWSQAHERIIFPLYKYIQSDNGVFARKLIGLLGRKLSDDVSKKPKWWTVRQRDIKHPRFIGLPEKILCPKQVVVVEDVLSAIRVCQTGRLSISLLTTYLPYELYPALRGWKVVLWLDADAHSKSIKYQTALGQNGIGADVIFTERDPKCYTTGEIVEAIETGKIKPKD